MHWLVGKQGSTARNLKIERSARKSKEEDEGEGEEERLPACLRSLVSAIPRARSLKRARAAYTFPTLRL